MTEFETDLLHFGINPFKQSLKVKAIEGKELFKKDETVYFEDAKDYVRVYRGRNVEKALNSLKSVTSYQLLFYIIMHIKYKAEVIRLKDKYLMDKFNISRGTYYKAKKELLNLNIINTTNEREFYWINPEVLFYGNRANHFTDNVVVKKKLF